MTREKKILVLFEDHIIRKESVQYSIELAQRMRMPVALLMLVSNESNAALSEDDMDQELLEPFHRAHINVSKEVRYGDKATEFLKYLAVNSSLEVIVWGSDEKMVGKLGAGKSHLWLNRMTELLPCTIVSPVSRKKVIGTHKPKKREG